MPPHQATHRPPAPGADELTQRWKQCFEEMDPHLRGLRVRDRQRRIELLALRYLEGRTELFGLRAGGYVGPASLLHHDTALRIQTEALEELRRSSASGLLSHEFVALQSSCAEHLDLGRVRLVLVGGTLDSGRGATAGALGVRHGAVVLCHDDHDHDHDQMLCRADRLLRLGEHVVLDAPWADEAGRRAARAIALGTSSDLIELRCVTHDGEGQDGEGQDGQRPDDDDSEAEPWPEATVIATDGRVAEAFEQASTACGWRTR